MDKLKVIARQFQIQAKIISITPYGNGHINDTYLVTTVNNDKFILQKINTKVFPNVKMLQNNIHRVTSHIAKSLNDKVPKESLVRIIPAKDGQLYINNNADNWRLYHYINNSISYETVSNPHLAYKGGKAFGQFQRQLADLPGGPLFEVIENFHNMKFRLKKFDKALQTDVKNRTSSITEQIEFVKQKAEKMCVILEMGEKGKIPLRITHNDTKLNNVLFDKNTDEVLSVIDLDTVMNGYVHYDFGDSIRTYTNTAAEDETDLSKVSMDIKMFEAYARGFLEEGGTQLNSTEIELLAPSAAVMTFIIGLRFITDYLDGDIYFKTTHQHHNLQRAKAQFKLVESIENQMEAMQIIINKLLI